MIWYIADPARYIREEAALSRLAATAAWLKPDKWRIDDALRLVWEADIVIGDRSYPIILQYPHHFPHVPPSVLPKGVSERWSGHQYGANGELCLEWRPDNWHPEIVGADMVESAYRLLSAESPADEGAAPVPVRDSHVSSVGQELRGVHSRFVQTAALLDAVRALTDEDMARITLRTLYHKESYVAAVASITLPDKPTWVDPGVPADLEHEGTDQEAIAWRWNSEWSLPDTTDPISFTASLAARNRLLPTDRVWRFVLIVRGEELHLYKILKNLVIRVAELAPEEVTTRLPRSRAALCERKVAIVGCGSLGSKIASALARSGVRRFLLIDDDVLLPGNLVRHDLDWRDVGTHKADAAARRIGLVAPDAVCETSRLRLGAQEASAGVDALLTRLVGCDLIVDATAEPSVFNLICGALASGAAALLWAEVFGGGIGGLIARHRPGLEPDPQTMRRTIEAWCAERNSPFEKDATAYGTGGATAMIADDADVSAIAADAARFALDTLQGGTSSFPHSVYLIGLAHAWIFEQPFDTHPIDVGPPSPDTNPSGIDAGEAEAALDRVVKLLQERGNARSPTA